MKRFLMECVWVVLYVLIGIATISFWFTLPLSWVFQPILFTSIVLVIFDAQNRALLSAVIGGVLLDLFSVLPFGVFTLSIFGSVAIVIVSQQTFLKARAIHTLIIHTIVATVAYHLLFSLFVRACEAAGCIGFEALPTVAHEVRMAAVQSILYCIGLVLVYGSSMVFRKRFIQASEL